MNRIHYLQRHSSSVPEQVPVVNPHHLDRRRQRERFAHSRQSIDRFHLPRNARETGFEERSVHLPRWCRGFGDEELTRAVVEHGVQNREEGAFGERGGKTSLDFGDGFLGAVDMVEGVARDAGGGGVEG